MDSPSSEKLRGTVERAGPLLKIKRPAFESWLCCLLVVGSWESHITTLNLNFLVCKMEIIISSGP